MALQPRQFSTILEDMINFVKVNSEITDFTVGSAVRTILEAAALEDDEQYYQIVQLLDAFNINTASGEDLDARVSDANLIRLQPASSSGKLVIRDENLVTDFLAFDVNATDTTVQLDDSSVFPDVGFPYTVRIGEGTIQVEDVTVSAHVTSTNTLTVSALVNDHSIGARVSFVSGASDNIIAAGVVARTVATSVEPAISFTTTEAGRIVNGNYASTSIRALANLPGSDSNVGIGKIIKFQGAAPFAGASVTNTTEFTGGRDIETDDELRDRYLSKLQSLSRGTRLSLKESVLGIVDPVTNQRVATSNVVSNLSTEEVIVYIDDGTGFVPDQVILANDSLASGIGVSSGTVPLNDASEFPDEGFAMVSPENTAQLELVEFSSVNRGTNTLNLASPTINAHDASDEVSLADVLTDSSEAGVVFYKTAQYPITRNSERIWIRSSGGNFSLKTEGVDYLINRGRGEIEFITPISTGSVIAATYTYYTGLVYQAQQIINGVEDDEINFPGVVAAGIIAVVETPTVRRVSVQLSITTKAGFEDASVASLVQEAVENYISSLKIGDDVILAEIIERAMAVPGMFNVTVLNPTSDVSVSSNELPVPFSASGASLVVVN